MRLAVYNVENLFDRAKVMNLESWADGRPVLDDFAELSNLLGEPIYAPQAKARMIELLIQFGLEKQDLGKYVILRRNKGGLLARPRTGGLTITAGGRADWVGSFELRDEPINHAAVRNTARVIHEVGADILAVVEAEHRPSLSDFNRIMLPDVGGAPYRHVMVIDGNDSRGIDVGLASRAAFPIGAMRSHVDDCTPDGDTIFSRDCPEFEIMTPSGVVLTVLVNHLKSKGYGEAVASAARRKVQAERVAQIYRDLIECGRLHVAVVGDLNDTPDSAALEPLLQGTDLKDVSELGHVFDNGGFVGTYDNCGADKKIDYILLSPALAQLATAAGVYRKGMWPGARARRWEALDTLTRPEEAASDHAALWVDLDL